MCNSASFAVCARGRSERDWLDFEFAPKIYCTWGQRAPQKVLISDFPFQRFIIRQFPRKLAGRQRARALSYFLRLSFSAGARSLFPCDKSAVNAPPFIKSFNWLMQKYHSPARPLPFALWKCDLYIRLFRRAAHWSAHGARGSYYLLYRVHSSYAGRGDGRQRSPFPLYSPLCIRLCSPDSCTLRRL